MKKLDEIPRRNVFEVPDGYFDRLPMKIQAKIESSKSISPIPKWNFALRFAVPVAAIILAVTFYLNPKSRNETGELLASITTENLVAYLNESELTENELLEAISFDEVDADSLNLQMQSVFTFEGIKESELENEL